MEIKQLVTPCCSYNNPADQLCFSVNCQYTCFICDRINNCECRNIHEECDKVDWTYIKKKLDKNIIKNTTQFKLFTQNMAKIYQNLKKSLDKAENDFKSWKEDFGLSFNETQFLKLIEARKFKDLKGKDVYKIKKEIQIPSIIFMKSQNEIHQEIVKIYTHNQSLLTQLKELYIKIEKRAKIDKTKVEQIKQQSGIIKDTSKMNNPHQQGKRCSIIINNHNIQNNLAKIFGEKDVIEKEQNIDKIRLTASDHLNQQGYKNENIHLQTTTKEEKAQANYNFKIPNISTIKKNIYNFITRKKD